MSLLKPDWNIFFPWFLNNALMCGYYLELEGDIFQLRLQVILQGKYYQFYWKIEEEFRWSVDGIHLL